MQLYAVLGGAVQRNDVMPFANFCLIQEDLYDPSDTAHVTSRSAYNSLHNDGEELTYGRYVEHKVATALQPLGVPADKALKEAVANADEWLDNMKQADRAIFDSILGTIIYLFRIVPHIKRPIELFKMLLSSEHA